MTTNTLSESTLDLPLLARGKVRDIYDLGENLLLVATDRLSAFDVILPTPIPDKGRVLTQLSLFWFDLLRDVIAAMIEANRTIYRDPDKAIPAIVEATQKPREAVEFAIGVLTKNCIPSVNTGFVRERTEWTHQNNIDIGDIPADKKLTFDQIANYKLAEEAVASLGGPVTINGCND